MPSFELKELLAATQASCQWQEPLSFSDVTTDTRKIVPGTLFIALQGERFNGEDFVAAAVQRGAAGVLVSSACPADKTAGIDTAAVLRVPDTLQAYQQIAHLWRMEFDLPVVAITGSNGKTTTKDLTAAVLSSKWKVLKTQANFNNEIGLPLTLLGLAPEHQAAVVEIGMRGLGQIAAMAPIAAPSIGVVTNVGETHLELLGSMENIAKAKAEMVEAIPAGGTVILNADNPYVAAMQDKAKPGVKVIRFGIKHDADVCGEAIHIVDGKTEFMVTFHNERYAFSLPMLGNHNVENALAALAVGFSLGFTAAEMQQGLDHLQATKMRFEQTDIGPYHVINDAYNASPMSMKAAFDTMQQVVPGRKVAVLGDMLELGDNTVQSHRGVGYEAARHGFCTLLTRGKLGEAIADGAAEGGMTEIYRCGSHEEAAQKLKEILQPGDTILFKGSRGMQMEKIISLLEGIV